MSLIERFTRDTASKYVWSIMALLAGIALVYAVTAGGEAVEAERLASQARAVDHARDVIPRLEGVSLSAPMTGQTARSFASTVDREVLPDERVTRLRVWAVDGLLLFSTDPDDRPGTRTGLNDALLRETSREGTTTRTEFSDTGGSDDPERRLVRTYVPVGDDAVIELDQSRAGTLGLVEGEWIRYQLLAGGALLLFLLLTALSLRDPIEPINVGVPFAATSIPPGYSLIDNDRLEAVHEVYRLASERVARLQERLEASEAERRRLEASIQQTLSKAASPPGPRKPAAAPAAPAPAAEAPAAPTPEPAVVEVPESEVVTSPRGERRAAAPAGPLARASRDQKPYETPARRPKPPSGKAKQSRKRRPTPKAEPQAPPAAAVVELPEVGKEPERRRPAEEVPPERPAAAASAPQPAQAPPARDVAWAAAKPKGRRAAAIDPDIEDARAHEAALETFIRLTESDRQPHESTEVDQGAVRAALARTAARKKPGGEGLHRPGSEPPHPQERLGGPPPERR